MMGCLFSLLVCSEFGSAYSELSALLPPVMADDASREWTNAAGNDKAKYEACIKRLLEVHGDRLNVDDTKAAMRSFGRANGETIGGAIKRFGLLRHF